MRLMNSTRRSNSTRIFRAARKPRGRKSSAWLRALRTKRFKPQQSESRVLRKNLKPRKTSSGVLRKKDLQTRRSGTPRSKRQSANKPSGRLSQRPPTDGAGPFDDQNGHGTHV